MFLTFLLLFLPAFLLLLVASLTVRAFLRPSSSPSPISWAGLALLSFLFLDGGLLSALPRLGLSFGPVGSGLFYLAVARVGLGLPLLLALLQAARRPRPPAGRRVLAFFWALNLALLALEVDAFYIEPFALQTTYLSLAAPGLSRPLRLVQISDLHLERLTRREEEVLARVEALHSRTSSSSPEIT